MFEQTEYSTGHHTQTRSGGNLLAVYLMAALALTGIVLVTGILNAHLPGRPLKTLAVLSGEGDIQNGAYLEDVRYCEEIGITGQAISEFCESFYQIPKGIYVVDVKKDSIAFLQGVMPGDVLLRVNGEQIARPVILQHLLQFQPWEETIILEFFRKGREYTVYLTPEVA